METGIDLYYFPASPPTRAVMLLAKFLGLVLNMKMVNIMQGDQLKPDFLKMNPMHTVPTIDDNGYVLWESRAIMQYLADRFDNEGRFQIGDPKQRGRVNQMLYFDADMLFPRLAAYMHPVMSGSAPPSEDLKASLENALDALNIQLENQKFAAGDQISLADFSLVATISTAEAIQVDLNKFANVKNWYENIKKELAPYGYEEINQNGANMIRDAFKAHV